ncbi:thermonuclease family protein [Calditrichota bacterium GD2]
MYSKLLPLMMFIILRSFCSPTVFAAQKIKIVKILDTNLFLLQDGRKISLANLQMPSKADTNQARQAIAQKILAYEHQHLLKYDLIMEPSPAADSTMQIIPVHLFQKLPLSKVNFNKELLKLGYAFYVPVDSLYHEEYEWAARKAQKLKRPLWAPERYLQRQKVAVFLGVSGVIGQFNSLEFPQKNDFRLWGIDVMIGNPYIGSFSGELKLGKIRIREKGFAACEAGPAAHYEVDALYDFIILNSQLNFTYFGFGVGFYYLAQTKRGFCDEVLGANAVPNLNVRLGYMEKFFISAELNNSVPELWQVGITYRFAAPFSSIWIGYLGINDFENFKGSSNQNHYIGIKGQYLFWNRLLMHVNGQIRPNSSDKFWGAGLSFKIYSN